MKYKSILILILITVFVNVSCTKDFEEINNNPAAFTTASDGSLFNDVINSLQSGWNEQFYINNEILYKQTQMAALFKEAWGNSTIGTEEIWANYYSNLPNIRELQRRFSNATPSAELTNMTAMVKIVLAYKTFKLTDLFGDIPYSEAGYGFQDVTKLRPKFDTQRSIYISLLEDLKWADENINISRTGEPYATFKGFDKLFFKYSNQLLMWRKFANSLRLRYAIRMSDKEPVLAGQIVADIINNNKPVLIGCDFSGALLEKAALYPADLGFKNEGKVWSFREHKNLRMGSNMWKLLSSNDSADGSGIFDARAYMFFDSNNNGKWAPYPQIPVTGTPAESGVPYMEQRNSAGGYAVKGADCLFSPFNYFLISDELNVPEIIMTGAEVHFLKSEAFMRGIGVSLDVFKADNEYLSGIQASLTFWKNTMSSTSLKTDGSKFDVMINVPSYLTLTYLQNKVGFWNFSNDIEKLNHIYSQQLIDFFRQPAEAFALVRRVYGKIPREVNGSQGLLEYMRFAIPPSEVSYNQANWATAYGSQDTKQTKVWWMK
ncbi:MAG: SusD/RagB family nutrient-binding outer membrane lipoprotein [Bacteroidales bacterium]